MSIFTNSYPNHSLLPELELPRVLGIEVEESDGWFIATADMPGMDYDEIRVEVWGGTLYVTAECDRVWLGAHNHSSVRLSRYLGFVGDVDQARAELKEGVLKVYVPMGESIEA